MPLCFFKVTLKAHFSPQQIFWKGMEEIEPSLKLINSKGVITSLTPCRGTPPLCDVYWCWIYWGSYSRCEILLGSCRLLGGPLSKGRREKEDQEPHGVKIVF